MKRLVKADRSSLYSMEHRVYTTAADRKRAQTILHKQRIKTLTYRDTAGEYALVVYYKSAVFEVMNS